MIYPTTERAGELGRGYDLVPVVLEVLSDTHTPVNVYLALRQAGLGSFLLESAQGGEQWGRFSFIGVAPKTEISIRDGLATVTQNGTETHIPCPDPFSFLREQLGSRRAPAVPGVPPFAGGLIGYFAYDMVRYSEKTLRNPPRDDLGLQDCHLFVCDEVIAYDHLRHKTEIIINVPTAGDFAANYDAAVRRAQKIATLVGDGAMPGAAPRHAEPKITANMTQAQYEDMVRHAKQYIVDGDIFQVVLSRRIEVENAPDAFDAYRVLRATNPSPYMYFFDFKECRIAGASPEMLVSVEGREVRTRPIAGTIGRGTDAAEDNRLENMLLSDPKEKAEHTMLVDLGRNDVGRVSAFGSVEVTRFMAVEKYSQLMHLVSDVHGRLRDGMDSLDALCAVLPAGTLSGAPKVRAMEIIDELEPCRRGVYGGTVGYIGFGGGMDTCIAIRTVLYRGDKAYIQAGAGIVYDSVQEKEFRETDTKARAVVNALLEAAKMHQDRS